MDWARWYSLRMGVSFGLGGRQASEQCSQRLRAIADPIRLSVLELLVERDRYVWELQESLRVEQSLLSHHLRTLRDEGLVCSHREGKSVRYSLNEAVRDGSNINLGCCEIGFGEKGAGSPGEGDPAV